jgi:KDO2-lipid IV(A) lauroyltransferase
MVIGLKFSRIIASKLISTFGHFFRSKKIIEKNISFAFHQADKEFKKAIISNMWKSYGKILAEYVFMKYFRKIKSENFLKIKGQEILEEIKHSKNPVIFVSGHFDNFELMAMHIERSGINLAAIYRPLNNKFLNPIMENIRKKYICKKQIQKGISGTKELLREFKNGTSIALMIDQRVSEGVKSNFFGEEALTTTIPAQFIKKFDAEVVPIYIERSIDDNFKIKIFDNIQFPKNESVEKITLELNKVLEKMIITNPKQWIWTHNRWKI